MVTSENFFNFISPGHLYLGAFLFSIVTAIFVLLIYIRLYVKKRLYFAKEEITNELNQWISEALIEETTITVSVSASLQQYLKKPTHRQYITDSLVNVIKNISGAATNNIIHIYEQLGLKEDAIKKLRNSKWHNRSRGIYELYMMRQVDAMEEIARYANSKNETVRNEAQTALVSFKGFSGLTFLTTLQHSLNNWQQLKLLEQLNKLNPEEMPELPVWLNSSNTYVQLFALKLADIYQQFGMHDAVVNCLMSPNENIRRQAAITLGRIANDAPDILKEIYAGETNINKRTILKQFCIIGSSGDIDFLKAQLADPDDNIKLEACRAMAKCNGWHIFEAMAGNDEVLASIARQVKFETGI